MYPGRHDVFFHPSPSPSKPYEPDPNLVTRYAFNQRRNEHILCKTCGCQIFEAREAKEGEKFDGWEEENLDDGNSFGINVALFNGMEEYLADGIGEKFRGLRKNERERWKEPLYEVKLTEG